METAPKNLAFYKGFSEKWSNIPIRSSARNTFFNTSVFASERAMHTYGKGTLLACVDFLRHQAMFLNGIDAFQVLYDMTGKRPSLLLVEEGDEGDRGIGVMLEHEKPLRTIVILCDEYYAYSVRNGWEWVGMRKAEK